MLALGLASSTLSVATTAALFLVTLCQRRLGRWWPSIVVPGLGWLAWYLAFAPSQVNRVDLGFADPASRLLAAFSDAFNLVEQALASVFASPAVYGPLLLVMLVVALVFLGLRGRLDRYDAVTIGIIVIYLAMVVVVRTTVREGTIDRPWYQFNIVILLVAMLVPKIPQIRTMPARAVAIAVMTVVLAVNVAMLQTGIDDFSERADLARSTAETAAAMLDASEPVATSNASLAPHAAGLTTTRVRMLQDLGLEAVIHPDQESAVRGRLRFVSGEPLSTAPSGLITSASLNDGCARLKPGRRIDGTVVGPGSITLDGDPGTRLVLLWSDDFGTGRRTVMLEQPETFLTPGPASPTEWRIRHRAGPPVEVCGLSSAGSPTPSFGQ